MYIPTYEGGTNYGTILTEEAFVNYGMFIQLSFTHIEINNNGGIETYFQTVCCQLNILINYKSNLEERVFPNLFPPFCTIKYYGSLI